MKNLKSFLFFSLAFACGLAIYTLVVIILYKTFYQESTTDLTDNTVSSNESLDDLEQLEELEDVEEDIEENNNPV